jgi:hypothetical protein
MPIFSYHKSTPSHPPVFTHNPKNAAQADKQGQFNLYTPICPLVTYARKHAFKKTPPGLSHSYYFCYI